MLFDSHAHLNHSDMTQEDRQRMISQIEASMAAADTAALEYVMDIGFDPESSALAVQHAKSYPWCFAAVGCHPHDTKRMDDAQLQRIRDLAGEPEARAIGEIGLDFHYDLSDRDVQREWFRRQIRLANELRMPICIHAREADQEVMDILVEEGAFSEERLSWFPKRLDPSSFCKGWSAGWEEAGAERFTKDGTAAETGVSTDFGTEAGIAAEGRAAAAREPGEAAVVSEAMAQPMETGSQSGSCGSGVTGDARVLLHCFSGSAELGKQYVRMGATLSIAGPVTYKNNKKTVRVVQEIPLDFLLVETDSPFLSPVPLRGKPNTPPNVEYTARKVAEIKGLLFEEVAAKTRENAMRFYGIG